MYAKTAQVANNVSIPFRLPIIIRTWRLTNGEKPVSARMINPMNGREIGIFRISKNLIKIGVRIRTLFVQIMDTGPYL